MPQTEFIVVRHGETAWNVEGRIQGHLDTPLNDEGLAQALMVGERLAREPFDAFYCSDLLRTRQTAQPLMDRTRRVPQLQSELRERHLGIFQGLTGVQCQQQFPEDYRRFHERDPDHVIPEGESVRQLYERITTFFADLLARHAGGRVVVVTHGGVLDALYRWALDIPLGRARDFPIFNASINRIAHDGSALRVMQWGDIAHLTRDAALDDF